MLGRVGQLCCGGLFPKMAAGRRAEDCSVDCDVVAQVRDILQLLSHYQWIYDVKVTQLFKERTWEKLPDDVRVLKLTTGIHGGSYTVAACTMRE